MDSYDPHSNGGNSDSADRNAATYYIIDNDKDLYAVVVCSYL